MLRLRTLGTTSLVTKGGQLAHIQPKRAALLIYIAVESAQGPVARDAILGLFWPHHTERRARASLRQALYYLNETLGERIIETHGWNEVALADSAVECDAVQFEKFLRAAAPARAIELYRGDFLASFFYDGMSRRFESWVDRTRQRLRILAVEAALFLADREERSGNLDGGIHWRRRALAIAPFSESILRPLLSLHLKEEDRASAFVAYTEFADRLAAAFDQSVSEKTKMLMDVKSGAGGQTTKSDEMIRRLEELSRAHQELERSHEELQSMNEQLRSRNEELQTMNEELRNRLSDHEGSEVRPGVV
jgi:DNA-binding SARP family transcriptional activator